MTKHPTSLNSPWRMGLATAGVGALLVLAAPRAGAQLSPQSPRTLQPTPRPGGLTSAQSDLVPVFDESTLVRYMRQELVRVSPDGRRELKTVLPSSHCAGLSPGSSRQTRLPDFRYGVKNEAPRSVAGIPVGDVQTPFVALLQMLEHSFGHQETVSRISPGQTILFTAPRRAPTTVQVTAFQVPARVRTSSPSPTPQPGSTGVMVPRDPLPSAGDGAHVACVADVFVKDPEVHVHADPDRKVKETNEENNRKPF